MGLGAGEEAMYPGRPTFPSIMPGSLLSTVPDGGWRMVLQLGWMESGKRPAHIIRAAVASGSPWTVSPVPVPVPVP
jgi:hypothetical protein